MASTSVSYETKRAIREAKRNDSSLSTRKLSALFGHHHATIADILNGPEPAAPIEEDVQKMDTSAPYVDESADGWVYGKNYTYNSSTDTYVLILKSRTQPMVLSGDKMRSMKRAYSNWDNQEATVNEVCRRFAVPRDQFMEIKTVLGWTHDQEPFTREEVMSGDVDTMVNDAYQARRQAVWEGFEQKKWQETKKAAENWNRLEQTFILPLQEQVETFAPTYVPQLVNIRKARNPFAVVANTGELHYGKAGWISETGESYNREIAEKRLVDARQNMLEEVADRGRPEKFIWAIGNDFLHIDNELGTTTKGTPQDCDGTAARILREGFELLIRDADSLLAVAPIEVVYVPGNHDHLLTTAMLTMLESWYAKNGLVTVNFTARSRSYVKYGQSILGFTHGDGALKAKDYISTMAKEAAEFWSTTKHRAFFTGHLHTEVVRELTGGTAYQMKSLSGQDRYHERNGYLSEAGMCSYIVDSDKGVTGSIIWKP